MSDQAPRSRVGQSERTVFGDHELGCDNNSQREPKRDILLEVQNLPQSGTGCRI